MTMLLRQVSEGDGSTISRSMSLSLVIQPVAAELKSESFVDAHHLA